MKRNILASIDFGPWPAAPSAEWLEELEEAFGWLMNSFLRSSQMVGDEQSGVINGNLIAYVRPTSLDALQPKFHTPHGLKQWERCTRLFGREPLVSVLDAGDPPPAQSRWQDAPWLILVSGLPEGLPPLRDPAGILIPSYSLPLDSDIAERLYFWSKDNMRLFGLWFSGIREVETLREMADPLSMHSISGYRRAQEVEKAIHKPVYISLFRHYGFPAEEELNRPCPLCGKPWKVEGEYYDFRCEPCRIVCDKACAEDENNWASIGAWQGTARTRPGGDLFPEE